MTILDRLLSALGLGGGTSEERGTSEPTVTVEHEPDASDEAAVKGVGTGTTADGDGDASEAPTAVESRAEPDETPDAGEATGGSDQTPDETPDADEATGGSDQTPDETPDADEETGGSVETVKGIGPAYAGQLADAGVGTVADLAAADAADLSERTSLSEKRLGRWIDRAHARLDRDA